MPENFAKENSLKASLPSKDSPNKNLLSKNSTQARSLKDNLLGALNFVLTADVFFVLASFVWFAIALLGRSLNLSLGFDLWYRLWEPLFMPAIGLLMAGALVSGITSWILGKLENFKAS